MKTAICAGLCLGMLAGPAFSEPFDQALTPDCSLLYNNISYPNLAQVIGKPAVAQIMKMRLLGDTDENIGKYLFSVILDGKATVDGVFGSIQRSLDIVFTRPECESPLDQELLKAQKVQMAKVIAMIKPMMDAANP